MHEELCSFTISRSFILKMRNILDKRCRETKKKKKKPFYIQQFLSENRALYEILWQNIVQPWWLQMTILRMRIASRIPNATNTLKYVILTYLLTYCMVQSPS